MRYLVVLNEHAGLASKRSRTDGFEDLREEFARAGVDAEIQTVSPDQLGAVVRGARASRVDAVIVGGGDGTVRSVASQLAGTGVPFGVLPMGTFNHFAKDLQVPADLSSAVRVLAGGVMHDLDAGEVNGHLFINNCSLGAYARAVRRRDRLRDRHGWSKGWAMVRSAWEEFRRLRPLRLTVSTRRKQGDGWAPGRDARPVRTPAIMVGNNRYHGRVLSQHLRPQIDAGELWIYTVQTHRHLAVLRMLWQTLLRPLDEIDQLAGEPAEEIVIESRCGPICVAADGELLDLAPPFHFRIRPRALRVIVPAMNQPAGDDGPDGRPEVAELRR